MRAWEKGRMRSLSAVADRKGVGGWKGVSLTIKKFFFVLFETIFKDPIKCLNVLLCSRWESQASVASSSLQSTSTLTPELVRIQDFRTSYKGRMVYWQCRIISRRQR